MRKILFLFILSQLPLMVNADAVEIDGIYYNLTEKTKEATVTINPNGYSGIINIPESVDYEGVNYDVTTIGYSAFSGCNNLISINMGTKVTSINNYAFYNCTGLISAPIPSGVTSIGESAFENCTGLISVTIPDNVTTISRKSFYWCSGMTSLTIGNNVNYIDYAAFCGCESLTTLTIPNSVTTIGDNVFYGCEGLKSVTIGNGVKSIGQFAFYICWGLTAVYISDLKAWCSISFSRDANPLINAHHLFLNGEEVKDLVIPQNVTTISQQAFYNCTGLTSLTIPYNMTNIGVSAFLNCSGLKSLNISGNVTSIDESAFSNCNGITSINLSDQLSIIRSNAFYNCNSLESITIPASVEYIYQNAFDGCKSLQIVNALRTTPPFIYDNTFSNYTVPLYVPDGCADAYRAAQGWGNFETINGGIKEKCATPTIAYNDGELSFSCETEGVEYCYSVTTPSSLESTGEKVKLTTKYTVSVYAKKDGYLDSDVAMKEIYIQGLKGDANGDGNVTVTDIGVIVNIILGKVNQNARKLENTMEPQ